MTEKMIILGSGPAGFTAAIYGARGGFKPLLIEGLESGGQLMTTTDVDNYPGFPKGIQGPEMMNLFREQAIRFDTRIEQAWVTRVDFSKRPFTLYTDTQEYKADSVIIATGASARWLGLPNETKLRGHGVSACATCDAFFYRGANVVVVGGGDTAMEEALVLAKVAKQITVVHRRASFRASNAMQERLFSLPNVSIVWDSVVENVLEPAENKVTAVVLKNIKSNQSSELKTDGLFIAIGHTPNTIPFKEALALNENGYIIVQPGTSKTSIPGIFAAGDVADPVYRQAVTAAGTGCMAALDARHFLEEGGQ